MIIRKASIEDIGNLFPLWEELMNYHSAHHPIFSYRKGAKEVLIEELKIRMGQQETCIFVAEENQRVLGFLIASHRKIPEALYLKNKGYIAETVVGETDRKKGIGKALYEEAEK